MQKVNLKLAARAMYALNPGKVPLGRFIPFEEAVTRKFTLPPYMEYARACAAAWNLTPMPDAKEEGAEYGWHKNSYVVDKALEEFNADESGTTNQGEE